MEPIQAYLDRADELAQEVIEAWNASKTGNFPRGFVWLLNETFHYRTVAGIVAERRRFDNLREGDEAAETQERIKFVLAYKLYLDGIRTKIQ